jgi:hypothetical protein
MNHISKFMPQVHELVHEPISQWTRRSRCSRAGSRPQIDEREIFLPMGKLLAATFPHPMPPRVDPHHGNVRLSCSCGILTSKYQHLRVRLIGPGGTTILWGLPVERRSFRVHFPVFSLVGGRLMFYKPNASGSASSLIRRPGRSGLPRTSLNLAWCPICVSLISVSVRSITGNPRTALYGY